MDLNNDTITTVVLEWLLKENYSKQHWENVAKEFTGKANNDTGKAIKLMADALKEFHSLYINKVVRGNNVLHDLLNACFEKVEWAEVAKYFLKGD